MVGTDDTPSAGNGVACCAAQNGLRAVVSAVSAKESVAVGIVSVDRAVDCINSVMSAALAVLSFVVNLRTLDLNFADAEVSLEVGHIVHGVPEAELYKRSQSQCFSSVPLLVSMRRFTSQESASGTKAVSSAATKFWKKQSGCSQGHDGTRRNRAASGSAASPGSRRYRRP